MSVVYERFFGESWVGLIRWDTMHEEFIAVTVHPTHITADFPSRLQFQLPVTVEESDTGLLKWEVELAEGRLWAHSNRHTGGIDTVCGLNKSEGAVARFTALPIDQEANAAWLGSYAGERTLTIRHDPRPDLPLFFYEAGDALVRLHPIAGKRFLSERCEFLTFGEGDPTTLTLKSGTDTPLRLHCVRMYREERVQIPTPQGHTLGATLLLPHSPAPYPVVLFCHFANTHFRDYYRLFADFFLEQGFATLIYDKRGWGDSSGEPLFSNIFPLADDAVSVYDFLHSHPLIQPNSIGFWGASNGGWVAPLAASRVEKPAFVIAVSAAGVTPAYQEQVRRVNIVRDLGATPEAVALLESMWQLLMDFYVNGTWTEQTATVLQQVYEHAELQSLPKQSEYDDGLQAVPPRTPLEELRATEGGTWAEGGFDPAPVYAGLTCPLLFVWGEAETVIPLEESVTRLSRALATAQHPDFQIVRLPRATHRLYLKQDNVDGLQEDSLEMRLHRAEFAAGCRAIMATWAKEHLPL